MNWNPGTEQIHTLALSISEQASHIYETNERDLF
jgi:hypothetical protein